MFTNDTNYILLHSKLGKVMETRFVRYSYTIVCMSSNTDHCDAVCLELLSRLLHPRGLGKQFLSSILRYVVCFLTRIMNKAI